MTSKFRNSIKIGLRVYTSWALEVLKDLFINHIDSRSDLYRDTFRGVRQVVFVHDEEDTVKCTNFNELGEAYVECYLKDDVSCGPTFEDIKRLLQKMTKEATANLFKLKESRSYKEMFDYCGVSEVDELMPNLAGISIILKHWNGESLTPFEQRFIGCEMNPIEVEYRRIQLRRAVLSVKRYCSITGTDTALYELKSFLNMNHEERTEFMLSHPLVNEDHRD